jgi:hypothetical protein
LPFALYFSRMHLISWAISLLLPMNLHDSESRLMVVKMS